MDEQVLQKAMERFDGAISKFEHKQAERVDDLQERIDSLERSEATGGTIGGGQREVKALGEFMKTGAGLREAKTISSATPSSNAMIPERVASQILDFAKDSSELINVVRVTPTQSPNYSRILRTTPPGTSWVGETDSRSATDDPVFRRRVPTAGEIHTLTTITAHVLEDNAVNLAQFLIEDVGRQMARELDAAIMSGNGTNRPTGILNTAPVTTADFASPLRSADAIQYVAAPSPDDITEHAIATYHTLQPEYRRNARWLMNSATLGQLRRAKASDGHYLWQPDLTASTDGGAGRFIGRPITIVESMADVAQSPLGFPIIVGDMEQAYELVQIHSPVIIRDEYTSPGFVKFYVRQRWGGILMNNDAIKAVNR
jgi:HK97 family phage major capsid protein